MGCVPSNIVEAIAETMGYFKNKKERKDNVSRPSCTWHGPAPGVIKLNSDGAVRSEQGFAAGGGVARDEAGFSLSEVLGVKSTKILWIHYPLKFWLSGMRSASPSEGVLQESHASRIRRSWRGFGRRGRVSAL
jgi:hypothetical protein